jgi:uncharacterized protein YndB with AHSA1/START domain
MMFETLPEQAGITIRLHRRFAAARERVFRAWTDPDILKQWWCPNGWMPTEIEIDLRVGGTYRIGMRRAEGGVSVSVSGHFLEIRLPERLVYTWRWENAFVGMPETRVTVQFGESDGGTEVVLIHENLPEIAVCLRHREGWVATWDRIEKSLAIVDFQKVGQH